MGTGAEQRHRLSLQHRDKLHAGKFAWPMLIKLQQRWAPAIAHRNGIWYIFGGNYRIQFLYLSSQSSINVFKTYSDAPTHTIIAIAVIWNMSHDDPAFSADIFVVNLVH